jgi:hypothetical protein
LRWLRPCLSPHVAHVEGVCPLCRQCLIVVVVISSEIDV